MRIALYGMPCAGKSTLLSKITNAKVINGGEELNKLCTGSFSKLSEDEKYQVRIKYTEYIESLKDDIVISDGHFSFMDNVVFTEADGEVYDVFMYLYCKPNILKNRYITSDKNLKYSFESEEYIDQWQNFEIESLRRECHMRNKDFYVISDNEIDNNSFIEFISKIRDGFSTYKLATNIAKKIMKIYTNEKPIFVVDGDKTIILEDSFRFCCNGKTKVFDGNFYTGYQSYLFDKELKKVNVDNNKVSDIRINDVIFDDIQDKNYIILSSGLEELWNDISASKYFKYIFASPYICADTKYYVVKILRNNGYIVNAYGDSKIDLYMLREADNGKLYIGKNISKSLIKEDISGLDLIYDHTMVILLDEDKTLENDVLICKSNSGVNGNRLAEAHFNLGKKLGERIAHYFPNNIAILVLERGGRFFGDGIYIGLGGTFYCVNLSKEEMPIIKEDRILIVDSVINTGKSIANIVYLLKKRNPNVDIVIASNVIQREAVNLFNNMLVFTIRISDNSFVGKNQAKQIGKTGPDTADRLFNIIEKRF